MRPITWILYGLTWSTNCEKIENEFGVHFYKEDSNYQFYGTIAPIFYTIRIPSPIVMLNETKNENGACNMKSKYFLASKEKIREYFEDVWLSEVNSLSPKNTEPKRSKRFISLVLGLAVIIGTFFLTKGAIEHFTTKPFEKEAIELNHFKAKVASELNDRAHESTKISELICDFQENQKISSLVQYLSGHLNQIENIVLSLTSGVLPTNRSIFNNLKRACILMQPNDIQVVNKETLCNKVLNFEYEFHGITIDQNSSLLLHLKLNVPILVSQFSIKNDVTKIVNIGFFHDKERTKLALPNEVFKFEEELYELDSSKCKNKICPFSGLYKSNKLDCFQGLKINDVSKCLLDPVNDLNCAIEPIPNGYLVLAKTGLLVHKNEQYPKRLDYSVAVTTEGHLFCANGRNVSFNLPKASNFSMLLNEYVYKNDSEFNFFTAMHITNASDIHFKLNTVANKSWFNFFLILSNTIFLLLILFYLFIITPTFAKVIKTFRACVKTPKKKTKKDAKIGPSNRTSLFETIKEINPYRI